MASSNKVIGGWWEVLADFVSDGVPIRKFRSQKSGLTLALAEIEGPLVYGYFALPTEAHDNYGLPHTLEHLTFLGSEQYPYKGVLDSLANRCLARGTNAWTDVDHTSYTVEVAGSEGFLNLLPVYLDHILYPTLTDSGFYTEVHHVTGTGEDAGVVYCEMQARENLSESILHRKLMDIVYPGDCGFKYETGGMMADLRILTAKQVQDYHKAFYRPDNLCLIVNGKIKPEEVFPALTKFEEKIISKGPLPPMARPWSTPVPPFEETTVVEMPFPADDEETGEAVAGWRGPKYDDFENITAMRVMWEYLSDSAIAPLQKALVHTQDPFCSEIDVSYCENSVFVQFVRFEGAPVQKLGELRDKFFEVIHQVVQEGVDMARMQSVIHREYLKYLNGLETRPHDTFAFKFILDFLYGKPGQLANYLGECSRFQGLKTKDSNFWINLIKSNLLDQPYAFVIGKPSIEFGKQMAEEEEKRVAAQAEALGTETLDKLANALEDAIGANEVQIPAEELERFPIPDTAKIPLIPISTFRNHRLLPENEENVRLRTKLLENAKGEELPPFFIQFDNIPSLFLEIKVLIDTTQLEDRYRLYLPLYLEVLFEAPILREDGQLLSHEEVVTQLNEDTLSSSAKLGRDSHTFTAGTFAQCVQLSLKSEVGKYERVVQWMRDFIWQTQFPAERLIISAQKLVNDAAQFKREGMQMVSTDIMNTNFDRKKSNHCAVNVVRQQKFLSHLLEKLKTENGAKEIVENFVQFRNHLCKAENIRVHVAGNIIEKLEHSLKPWLTSFMPRHIKSDLKYQGGVLANLVDISHSHEYLVERARNPEHGNVLSLAAIESSYLTQTFLGPTSWNDPDVAPLMVLIEYLTTMEGPFWKQLRGAGLSYSYAIRQRHEQGLLGFVLFKSVSIPKAHAKAQEVLLGFAQGQTEFEETGVAAAKSSAIFEVISREETAPAAASNSLLNYLLNAPSDLNKQMLERLQAVTVVDLHRVLKKHLVPLFTLAQANLSIATNPKHVDEIKEYFEKAGKKMHVVNSLDDHFA